MTDTEATRLGTQYAELEAQLSKAVNRGAMADVHYIESGMARIEARFQKADLDLDDYRDSNN